MRTRSESVSQIMLYALPELISIFIIIALPPLLDNYLLATLGSTAAFGTLGLASNVVHNCIKFSEAIPVASVAIIGRYNGAENYSSCGQELVTTFWTCCIVGLFQFCTLFFGASAIYRWLGAPEGMVALGTPLLKLRACSILLAFILWSLIYFLRAIKNTHTPMIITLIGTITYISASLILIPGRWGIPGYGMYGAAYAALLQYGVMLSLALSYLYNSPEYAPYFEKIKLFLLKPRAMLRLFLLSIPIMIDKTSLSFAYVWLSKMITPLGSTAIASFDLIKNIERSAIMPAAACAHVATFLVSNYLGAHNPSGARKTIYSILGIALACVALCLGALFVWTPHIVTTLSPDAAVTAFATPLLRMISGLVLFDVLQLVLAAALRGAGNVRVVMWVRFVTCIIFFVPLSRYISSHSTASPFQKFMYLYSSFYITTALMGGIFLVYILKRNWYKSRL